MNTLRTLAEVDLLLLLIDLVLAVWLLSLSIAFVAHQLRHQRRRRLGLDPEDGRH